MKRRWAGLVAAALGLAIASPAAGQETGLSTVSGTVFDSIAATPLAGAEVTLAGGTFTAVTDAQGRFRIQVPPGSYPVTFSHPDLSAWGVLRHGLELRVEPGRDVTVSLTTASEATVLQRTCGSGAVVGGVVRDLLTLVPLAGTWVDVDTRRGGGPRGMVINTAGDGSWFACLPDPEPEVVVQARMSDTRSRPATVPSGGVVRTQDLYLQVSQPARIRGQVLDGEREAPLADAWVEVVGTRLRTLTGEDGRFSFRGVPPGAVQLAVQRLGFGRKVTLVRAEGGSEARVTVTVFPEAIAVDSVVATVEGGFVDRNRMATRFDGMTRAQVDAVLHRSVGFDDLVRNANVPGLRVRRVEYMRASGFREVGLCLELSRRSSLENRQCQMMEVYLNDARMSEPEINLASLDPASVDRFQVLTPTNAGIEYMGTPRSRNGILLIWTRR